MDRWPALLGFVAVVVAAAAVGALATLGASGQYAELERPPWAPLAWLFAPVWTALYAAVAAWRVWLRVGLRSTEMALFGAQLAVNVVWPPLFFAWDQLGLALAWILLLDALVAATALWFWRRDPLAGALLAPYLLWVLFATALNGSVWWLNR